jgi:hypothetical protein
MEPHDEPLRERLMAQQEPCPEQLARYRRELEAVLEKLRRRKWWVDAARAVLTTLGAVVLFPLAALFGLTFLWFLAGGRTALEAWFPATAGLVCLAGAVGLLRWYFRRREDDLLLGVKRLQAQGLQFEEQLRRQGRR